MSGSSTPEYKTRASTQQPGGPNTTSADSRLLDAAETLVTLQSVSSRGQGNKYTIQAYNHYIFILYIKMTK